MFLDHILSKIREFLGLIPKEIRIAASNSVTIVNGIKGFLNSPEADILTAIIPGTWDDELKEKAKGWLNAALPYVMVVDACKDKTDTAEMLRCWADEVAKQPVHIQAALLNKLASLLTALQDDKTAEELHNLQTTLYDTYTQLAYAHTKTGE